MHPIERLRAVARAQGVDQRLLAREAAATLGVLADEPFGLVPSCRRLIDRHPGAGVLWWACARLLDSPDARAESRSIIDDLADDAVVRTLALDVPERATVVIVPDPGGGSPLADLLAERRDDVVVVEAEDPAFDVPAMVDASETPAAPSVPGTAGEPGAAPEPASPRDPGAVGGAEPGTGPTIVLVEPGAAGPDAFIALDGTAAAVGRPGGRPAAVWLAIGPGRRLAAPLFEAAARRAGELEVVPLAAVDRVVEPRRLACPAPPELLRDWSS
jgi:hypothetical protein